jgi:hypothetical protein
LNALLRQQHFDIKALEISPNHKYHGLEPEAEHSFGDGQALGIYLINEPQEWINGFDAGFNNRPFSSNNTRQYCEGYLHGQHAWRNPTASPSLSSTASEVSSLASLDAGTIDPKLLDVEIHADDQLLKTPTQLNTATLSDDWKGSIGNRAGTSKLSPSLSSPPQSNTHMSHSTAPSPSHAGVREAGRGSGRLLDTNFSSLHFSLPATAGNAHEAITPAPSWTPVNAHETPHIRSAPTRRTSSSPLFTYNAHGNVNHMSPCVRRSLSMAKQARVAAELLGSQGRSDAAAAAVVHAASWEKKARRRQAKNESQNRIRAQERAKKLMMQT